MTSLTAQGAPDLPLLPAYDAGLLSDFGGGSVDWWQNYIRAELGRAHDFYESHFADRQARQAASEAEAVKVYLIATGEFHGGYETYTRHENFVPMCDYEVLYTQAGEPVPNPDACKTVPWPQVDAYAGGAASGGVAAWLEVRLGDGPELTEFVRRDLAAEPVPVEAVSEDTKRLDWLLPNLHPANFGMGFEWDTDAEFLAGWRKEIDAAIAASPSSAGGA